MANTAILDEIEARRNKRGLDPIQRSRERLQKQIPSSSDLMEELRIRRLRKMERRIPGAETSENFESRMRIMASGQQRLAGGEPPEFGVETRPITPGSDLNISKPTIDFSGVESPLDFTVEEQPITPGSSLTIKSPRASFKQVSRGDLALSDTFEEKRAKFMERNPNGDFQEIPGQANLIGEQRAPVIIFRRNQDEEFARLDRSDVDLLEIFGDIADFAGDGPAILGEAIMSRQTKGLRRYISIFFGGAGGEALKQVIEDLRGFQRENAEQLGKRVFFQGAVGVAGGYASKILSGPINFKRGAPIVGLKPGSEKAMKAAKALEIPPFMPGQVTTNPLVTKMMSQAAAVLPRVDDYIIAQHEASVRAIMRLRDRDVVRLLLGDLDGLQATAEKQALDLITFKNPDGSVPTLRETGLNVQAGIAEWEDLAEALDTRRYGLARAVEEPEFSLEEALRVADELEGGIPAIDSETGEVFGIGHNQLSSDVKGVIEDLRRLGPTPQPVAADLTIKGIDSPVIDQLRGIRKSLWNLKTKPPGGWLNPKDRAAGAQAAKLYSAITEAMRNPTNASEEFKRLYAEADAGAARHFTTREKLTIREAAKSERPSELALRFATQFSVDDVIDLKAVLPASRMVQLQNGVIGHLTNRQNLLSLRQKMDANRLTYEELFTPLQLRQLDGAANEILRLNQMNIPQVLEEQATVSGVINALILNNNSAAIKQIKDTANPVLIKRIRAGLMEDIVGKVVKHDKRNINQVVGADLDAVLTSYRESGAIGFLTLDDLRVLKNLEFAAPYISVGGDTGSSLQAGEAVSGIRSLRISAFGTLLEHYGTGRLFTSEGFQRALLGNAKDRGEPISLHQLGAALAILAVDLEEDSRLDVKLGQ